MSKKLFTEEEQQLLRQNPYVYSVSGASLSLTKEFKMIFLEEYQKGQSARSILENYGFDTGILGDKRVCGIASHICREYRKYGEFGEGRSLSRARMGNSDSSKPVAGAEEIRRLKHEVDYLKQEMEFLKKISAIRTTRK